MKKIMSLTFLFIASLSVSAYAETIKPGQSTQCENANSIIVEVAKVPNKSNPNEFGYTANDRGTANLVVWKSSNGTTVPLTLGPNDDNRSLVSSDHGLTGLGPMGTMGAAKVVLSHQPAFSRGDSIGDISGVVRFTNTGTNPVTITCK